jgi:hypothetical protein
MTDDTQDPPNFDSKIKALGELPLTADDPRFASDRMVTCGSCSRTSPPNRTSCLYCGDPLDIGSIDASEARINFQQPEPWEDGFSLVYSGALQPGGPVIESAAEMLHLDIEQMRKLLASRTPVPLVYLRTLADAGLLGSRLSAIGFDCAIVGDDLLQVRTLPTRLRSVAFENDRMLVVDFNTGKETAVNKQDPILIVAGSIIKTSTEVQGKLSKRTMKAIDETMSITDEPVLDIYPPSDVYGFRIRSSGFDFSSLGDQMTRFTGENLSKLTGRLREFFADARFIDGYPELVQMLAPIWPPDEIRQSSRVTRGTFGGVRKQSLTILDNTAQFTRFSRLQRHSV